jgi:hypothetical protein
MSRSVTDLLGVLDDVDVPDQWGDIVGRSGDPEYSSQALHGDESEVRGSGWLVGGLAAAAGVALIVGGVVWLSSADDELRQIDEPAATTVATTVATGPPDEVSGTSGVLGPGDALEPAEVAGMTLTWTRGQSGEDSGPLDALVATLGLEKVSFADAGSSVFVSGTRTDGSMALLRSEDDETLTDIDVSALSADQALRIVAATPSGLVLLGAPGPGRNDAGPIAVIENDRVTGTYEPPWNTEECCALIEIVELNGDVVAYQANFNGRGPGVVYRYLGGGEWSDPIDVPISSDHAQVGDTALMFDHTYSTCCASPIPGLSEWPLLASNDGINWTQIDTRSAENVHALRITAGDSFWLYGPDIGGGGYDIETNANTTLWISRDSRNWEPIDIPFAQEGFVQVSGNTITLIPSNGFDDPTTHWIGTVTFNEAPG